MRRLVLPVLAGLALAGCGDRQQDTGSPPFTVPTSTTSEVQVSPKHDPKHDPEPDPKHDDPKLSPQGKDVLEQAKRSGVKTVVLTVATDRDKTDQVAAGLRSLGGTVEATDTTIGYVRVSVPVDLAEQVTTIEGISRVDVDEPLFNIDPTP